MQESQKRNTGQFNEELAEIHAQGESLQNSRSPRSAFQRVRDKSLKELSESFVSAQGMEASAIGGPYIKSQMKQS